MALSSPPLHNLSSLISSHGVATATSRTSARRYLAVHAAASDTTTSLKVSTFEEGNLVRPKWTGETPLSRLVRALISFKPLYSILKLGARQVLIRLTIALCITSFVTFFNLYNRTSFKFNNVNQCVFLYEWMHSTAEKNNIPWREMTKEILESDVYKELDTIQNKSLVYPDCNFIILLFFLFFLYCMFQLSCDSMNFLYRLFESIPCIWWGESYMAGKW